MSRSNYSEDFGGDFNNQLDFYRRNVENAIYGKRGQNFIREMIDALDEIPGKRLITGCLENDGDVCAIGSVGVKRGLDMDDINPSDSNMVGRAFGIASVMVAEIVFENDEVGGAYWVDDESPEARWQRMRDWAVRHLKENAR